jgi:Glycosyltransferase family 87
MLVKHPRRRVEILCGFLLGFLVLYVEMVFIAMPQDAPLGLFTTFMTVWGVCFFMYFVASIWVMMTRPLPGRWLWVELGLILGGALVFRLMLINLPLGLSPDAWRYLWDARVTLHGYSPYTYAPFAQILAPLRDIVFANSRYRQFPTKYPPGAELFFILGYLLNPTNLVALKGLFVLCDLVTCGALTVLLVRKGLDPRRVLIYAWCPLPIVEFAIQGHSDAIAVTFMVLAVLCAQSSRQSLRLLAGVCIGLAALARLYPILLLLVLVRRRDWGLVVACISTLALGYLPFILLGQGDVRSVLLSFSGQQDLHLGVLDLAPTYIAGELGIRIALTSVVSVTHVLEMAVEGITVLVICIQRLRKRMSEEAALLLLIAVTLMVYAHVFPWYITALLPWIAILAVPVWTREGGISAKGLTVVMVWYFTCTVVLSYVAGLKQISTASNWLIYYGASFGVMVVGLVVAAVIGFLRHRSDVKPAFSQQEITDPAQIRLLR